MGEAAQNHVDEYRKNAVPVVDIEGSPLDRGVSYGEQAAERVQAAAGMYERVVSGLNLSSAELDSLANLFLAEIEKFDETLAEEMRGISRGSGVPLFQIVLINARREIVSMAIGSKDASGPNDDECTAAAVLPTSTTSNELFHGQNWDTSPQHIDHCLVLRVRRSGGPTVLTFTEAGAVSRSGMNSVGIVLTANHIASDRDYRNPGVPLPLIRRRALEQPTLSQALAVVYATPKSGSNNMTVSRFTEDGAEIVNVECAPDESFLDYPDPNGLLTHSNNWQNPAALTKLRDHGATLDTSLASTPCTMFRAVRLRRIISSHISSGQLTFENFRASFLDQFDSPYSICRPPREAALGSGMSATAATIVMNPAQGFMDVAPLPGTGAVFSRYHVDGGDPEPVDVGRG